VWLEPVERALADATGPVDVFFRDDDAGWADDRLFDMLDVFARHATPVDLAVIPFALEAALAGRLVQWQRREPALLGLHQHGARHVNHEATGRKCEFGPSRSREDQWADIGGGQKRLETLLGSIDPIFTPPWNRCTSVTADCLERLGFRTLSQDLSAPRLGSVFLERLPVAVDWCKWREGPERAWQSLGQRVADALSGDAGPVGIMLHHAVMDEDDRSRLDALLATLARSNHVRCHRMVSLVTERTLEVHS